MPPHTPWFPDDALSCLGEFYALCLRRLGKHEPGSTSHEQELFAQAVAASAYAALAAARLFRAAPTTVRRAADLARDLAAQVGGSALISSN